MSVLIKGGKVFHKGVFSELDVLIEYGKIVSVGGSIGTADETYDAKDMLVLPGLVDPHVHLRDPGATAKEDFHTGTQAAVAGGFTTVMDMPNNPYPTVDLEALYEKASLAERKAVCEVRFHFGATDHNFEEIKRANPLSLKVYLGRTTGELQLTNPKSLEKHFGNYAGQFVFHASGDGSTENDQLEKTFGNIGKIGSLSIRYRRKSHIAHVSCGREVLISKSFGLTVETAPHYLFLNSSDAEKLGYRGTVYPNLRSEALRKSLWGKIDRVDCIATDHAPHTLEDKKNGAHGFPGLETSLALMLETYHTKQLTLEWIVKAMSEKPAALFGLDRTGKIEKGFHGNITVLDPKKEWTVKGEELYTKCRWSPFEGRKLKGKAKSVFYKGRLVFDDFRFTK